MVRDRVAGALTDVEIGVRNQNSGVFWKFNKNGPKRVEKIDLGVSGGQERSKFRCGSIGSAPGHQKRPKK